MDEDTQTNVKGTRCKRWRVNKRFLPLKLFYFFFYGACGSVIPFISVYLKHLNLSASETGLITGMSVLLAMFLRAFIGMVADKLSARKSALIICSMGFSVAFFCMWFVPDRPLLLHLRTSDTENNDRIIFPEEQRQPQMWICLTKDGSEICRYPHDGEHIPCRIKQGGKVPSLTLNVSFVRDHKLASERQEIETEKENGLNISQFSSLMSSRENTTFQKDSMTATVHDPKVTPLPKNVSSDNVLKSGRQLFISSSDPKIYLSENDNSFEDLLQKSNNHPCFYVSRIETSGSFPTQFQHSKSIPESFFEMSTATASFNKGNSRPARGTINDDKHSSKSHTSNGLRNEECLSNCTGYFFGLNSSDVSNRVKDQDEDAGYLSANVSESNTFVRYGGVTPDLYFFLSFLLITTARSFYSTSTSLADTVAYTLLGDDRLKWGQQRLWGTLGTAVAVLSVTTINDSLQDDNFTALFFMCVAFTVVACVVGLWKLRADKMPKKKSFLKDIGRVLSKGAVRLFLGKLIFYGMMCGSAQNFFLWFMVDLGSNQIVLGLCVLIHCASSVLVLRFTARILKRIGQINTMYIVLITYVVRFVTFSFLTSAWMALPIEVLHGLTYSMFWAAASSTVSIVAPPGTQASCQAMAGAMYWDFGRGLGNFLTGQLLDTIGARWTFRAYGVVCAVVLPVVFLLDRTWPLCPQQRGIGKESLDQRQLSEAGDKLLLELEVSVVGNDTAANNDNNNTKDTEAILNNRNPTGKCKTPLFHGQRRLDVAHGTNLNNSNEGRGVNADKGSKPIPSKDYGDVNPAIHQEDNAVNISYNENGRLVTQSPDFSNDRIDIINIEDENFEYDCKSFEKWADSYLEGNNASSGDLTDDDTIESISSYIAGIDNMRKMRPKSDSLIPNYSFHGDDTGDGDEDIKDDLVLPS